MNVVVTSKGMGGSTTTSSDETSGNAGTSWDTEPPLVTSEGHYTRVPSFSTSSSSSKIPNGQGSTSDTSVRSGKETTNLNKLTKEELISRVHSLESQVSAWERLSSSLVAAIALGPDTNAMYARLLRSLLSDALRQVEAISELLHVECSLPSIAREKPGMTLLENHGLSDTLWDVEWTPTSWWVSVAATGARWGIPFQALTTVRRIRISGRLRCAFASDATAIRVAFDGEPRLDMEILAEVGWGVVPLPVQQQIELVVREELRRFITDTLVGDNSTVFVLRRKSNAITQQDLIEAKDAARRANNVKLHSVK